VAGERVEVLGGGTEPGDVGKRESNGDILANEQEIMPVV
jgi:hypothetical protein